MVWTFGKLTNFNLTLILDKVYIRNTPIVGGIWLRSWMAAWEESSAGRGGNLQIWWKSPAATNTGTDGHSPLLSGSDILHDRRVYGSPPAHGLLPTVERGRSQDGAAISTEKAAPISMEWAALACSQPDNTDYSCNIDDSHAALSSRDRLKWSAPSPHTSSMNVLVRKKQHKAPGLVDDHDCSVSVSLATFSTTDNLVSEKTL